MKILNKKRIYLDHAASTPVRKEVLKAMKPFWNKNFANAGAIHLEGLIAKTVLEESRRKVANVLKAQPEEIIFTASGTEANSLAIFGVVDNLMQEGIDLKDMHLITTTIEHPSILQWFEKYEKRGVSVSYIGIDEKGIVDLKQLRESIRPETVLVSIMYANNEIGTIQPIGKISRIIKDFNKKHLETGFPSGIVFHTDASQAPLYLNINVHSLGIDMLTIDGQKIYGPKGVGALYKKNKLKLSPILFGGKQENGYRAGTENIPLIVGLTKALELADLEKEKESARLLKLQNLFIKKLKADIKGIIINGSEVERLPNNINISIPNIDGEFMVIKLDKEGIACSTKSACIQDGKSPSYVIDSLRTTGPKNSLRFTLGKSTTKKDIEYVVKTLKKLIQR